MTDYSLPTRGPESASHDGPAAPSPDAVSARRPLRLDQVRLAQGGLLGGWQERNAEQTLPHCIERLQHSGNLDNVRRVTGQTEQDFVGMWFADSDIYKTMEAAAWELGRAPTAGAHLREFLDTTAALLTKAQDDDGYLNSYFQVDHRDKQWQELRWSHELYCAGHLIQAGVAAARAGVAEQLVTVARRMADLLVQRFGPDGVEAVCGHPEIETALVELFRVTDHRPYLHLAAKFVDLRGRGLLGEDRMGRRYYQDHTPVRQATEVTGHAVRQLYLLAGAVDVAVETGDSGLLEATGRLWESAFHTRTYLTGAHGSRHRDEAFGDPYELPPDRAYGETCAAIASFHWNWRMLLATGEHRYAEEMERVLYNTIAGATALDGRHFFYTNTLHLRAGHDGSHEDAPSQRLPWYSCSCCPPNLARLMASLQSYVATTDGTGLQLHLYAAGTISTVVRGQPVEVAVEGDYPWDGRITVRVRSELPGPWTLALRVPAWCANARVEVDELPGDGPADPGRDGVVRDGYLWLTRDWSTASATVHLELSMPPRLVAAHPHVDAVRGCLALLRGPLVYCLEQADLPAGVALQDVWLDPSEQPRVAGNGAAGTVGIAITAGGFVRPASAAALYRPRENGPDAVADQPPAPVELRLLPYFRWANRATGAMRVWLPAGGGPAGPGPGAGA